MFSRKQRFHIIAFAYLRVFKYFGIIFYSSFFFKYQFEPQHLLCYRQPFVMIQIKHETYPMFQRDVNRIYKSAPKNTKI